MMARDGNDIASYDIVGSLYPNKIFSPRPIRLFMLNYGQAISSKLELVTYPKHSAHAMVATFGPNSMASAPTHEQVFSRIRIRMHDPERSNTRNELLTGDTKIDSPVFGPIFLKTGVK
ncbi:hypothetical protein TNCV_3314601 [Trichonephila clavipes]|nr:hypothetical protein TNCV_3314601 [Trichonephila clavipes]